MQLLSKQEVARIFNVSERTIEIWEKKNILKPVSRIANRPRYSKVEVELLAGISEAPQTTNNGK